MAGLEHVRRFQKPKHKPGSDGECTETRSVRLSHDDVFENLLGVCFASYFLEQLGDGWGGCGHFGAIRWNPQPQDTRTRPNPCTLASPYAMGVGGGPGGFGALRWNQSQTHTHGEPMYPSFAVRDGSGGRAARRSFLNNLHPTTSKQVLN